jgi:hypothetical protein
LIMNNNRCIIYAFEGNHKLMDIQRVSDTVCSPLNKYLDKPRLLETKIHFADVALYAICYDVPRKNASIQNHKQRLNSRKLGSSNIWQSNISRSSRKLGRLLLIICLKNKIIDCQIQLVS